MSKKDWIFIIVLIILVNGGISLLLKSKQPGDYSKKQIFEFNFTQERYQTLNKQSFTPDTVKNRFFLVVVISPNDCPSCLKEMKQINQLYNTYKNSSNLFFLAIFTGDFQDPFYMKKILGIQFPVILIKKLPGILSEQETPFKFIWDKNDFRIVYFDQLRSSEKDQMRFYHILKFFAQ